MRPYFALRSYADTVKCYDCIQMEYAGRDPRQAWPDYAAHVRDVHQQHYDGQIGSEPTPQAYLEALWACTAEWARVLKPSGSVFVNLGDKYAGGGGQWANDERPDPHRRRAVTGKIGTGGNCYGSQPKSLLGLPWRYAIGCMDRLGLILRAEIVWAKPNGLPESVTDRVRRSHEQVFHFTRQPRYYTAVDEIREGYAPGTAERYRSGYVRTLVSSSGQTANGVLRCDGGGLDAPNPLGKLPGSVWEIPSAPLTVPAWLGVDHFAAYPPELCRRIILGWSPPGICTACGEGRRPVVDKRYLSIAGGYDSKGRWGLKGQPQDTPLPTRLGDGVSAAIAGYSCACPDATAPARPAVVVDPFGGTGTTALVASAYGRTGITVDRSADYCRLARWRTRDPGERARALNVPKPPPVPDGQQSLFDETEAS